MLQVEQVLQGRYQLKEKLGHNAGRQTWLAEDLETKPSEKVIVKLLAFGGDIQWDDLKLFEREAQILKHLKHPQIPRYRDYFSLDERVLWFCLVQEYIPGASLKDLLKIGKRFTEKEVRLIAESLLNILSYLHELNPPVFHRDIKPSNVILGENKRIYLVDFGAVQDKAAAEGATFTVVGTYGYAPIEQFGGRTVPASDLYALGATLIHLLTGTSPADLPQKDLRIHFSDRTNANTKFIQWIEKLTEPSVEKRFAKAEEALKALKNNRAYSLPVKKVTQPQENRIKINRSRHSLFIKLPSKELSFGDGLVCVIVILLLAQFSFGSIVLIIQAMLTASVFSFSLHSLLLSLWLFLGYRFLINKFGYQIITFKAQSFLIEKWLFNHCAHQRKGYISDIQDVFQSVQISHHNSFQANGTEEEMVTIQTIDKRYSFGLGLSAIECLWLAQEIKDWLNSR
ncbi:serine/threonine protein kinase [Phormidium sp. LEGE 05292]|uniref:serine/threonine protein kinase n=1 Tax=[Phormidium] sp. LEGE 05292 TaxID=767427 RepID=UPI00187F6BF7|nr:serine/threonine-protein kinase [Phormidium sp. LEGE 05292]MBE9225523.1 serine/threonine protein kinase [Phormidium sp. LEGE 05292]